ncbi:MAG TPA: histidine kinase N-terminal 7TM domain-containing protein [Patescibacteria group bacterium]|nr:histidine kinase N-terminal 7TM domain-containing protein [Patescibacteria group bacterium]
MNLSSSVPGESTLQVMIYHPVNDIWLYLLSAMVLQSLTAYTWRYRQNPAALYMAVGIPNMAIWLLTIVMISVSPALADKLFWVKIEQMSSSAIIPTVLLFALHVTEQKTATIRTLRTVIMAVTAGYWLAVLTSDWHNWLWSSVIWDGVTFGVIRGPVFWVMLPIAYLVFAGTVALYIRRAATTSGLLRWQAVAMPLGMLLSVAGHARWMSTQSDPISPMPLCFLLGGLLWFAIFFGLRVFNLMELAQATVTRDMNDSLIVIDAQGYIVELNPAAQALFSKQAALVGSRFAAAFACWPALIKLAAGSEARTGEISLAGSHHLFRVTPLAGWGNRNIGQAIILQDITELKQAQEQIVEQQKALLIATERELLGRELHDGHGQIWNYFNLELQTLRSLSGTGRMAETEKQVDRLIGIVKELNADVRESIVGLKKAAATGDDFITNLQEYLAWYEKTNGIVTRFILPPDPVKNLFRRTSEVQLLRIILEALTNIRKHARARQVTVAIVKLDDQVAVSVADDGCGFDTATLSAPEQSFGLQIMAERAVEAGGILQVYSKPGEGTKVTVRFPLEKEAGIENAAG